MGVRSRANHGPHQLHTEPNSSHSKRTQENKHFPVSGRRYMCLITSRTGAKNKGHRTRLKESRTLAFAFCHALSAAPFLLCGQQYFPADFGSDRSGNDDRGESYWRRAEGNQPISKNTRRRQELSPIRFTAAATPTATRTHHAMESNTTGSQRTTRPDYPSA